jgi:hypothetical protein
MRLESAAALSLQRKPDAIYTRVLANPLKDDWTANEKELAVYFSWLAVPCLAAFVARPEFKVLDVLSHLHSKVDIPKDRKAAIRLHSASVHVFLCSSGSCNDARFWVEERQALCVTACCS